MTALLRPATLLALLAVSLATALGACGAEEHELEVVEGEPIEFEDVRYNVVLSRFLNPADEEDAAYVEGQEIPPPTGQEYFGIFMQIENESDETVPLPEEMTIVDTLDNEFTSLDSESPFAMELGGELPAGEEVPEPNSVAADGPTQGALVLFLIDEASSENRPLELEVPLPSGETGLVELDI